MKDKLIVALGAILLVVLFAGSAWVWTSAPCGLWAFSKVGEMPARCIFK